MFLRERIGFPTIIIIPASYIYTYCNSSMLRILHQHFVCSSTFKIPLRFIDTNKNSEAHGEENCKRSMGRKIQVTRIQLKQNHCFINNVYRFSIMKAQLRQSEILKPGRKILLLLLSLGSSLEC